MYIWSCQLSMLLQETEQVGELCNGAPGGHALDSSGWMMATSGVVHLRLRGEGLPDPTKKSTCPTFCLYWIRGPHEDKVNPITNLSETLSTIRNFVLSRWRNKCHAYLKQVKIYGTFSEGSNFSPIFACHQCWCSEQCSMNSSSMQNFQGKPKSQCSSIVFWQIMLP